MFKKKKKTKASHEVKAKLKNTNILCEAVRGFFPLASATPAYNIENV